MPLQKLQKTGRFRNRLQQAAAAQIALLAVFLGAVIIISTGMGYIQLPPATVVKIIFAKLSGQPNLLEGMDSIFPVVVMDVRLPRILSAAIVGAGLAISYAGSVRRRGLRCIAGDFV
jgi:iron complex transport system permease protein